MNEPRTIEQTREAKEQLRKSIAELIGQFERDYPGILVDSITLDRTEFYGDVMGHFFIEIETILK